MLLSIRIIPRNLKKNITSKKCDQLCHMFSTQRSLLWCWVINTNITTRKLSRKRSQVTWHWSSRFDSSNQYQHHGSSLVVQWFRPCVSTAGPCPLLLLVRSLVGELRSCVPHIVQSKKKNLYQVTSLRHNFLSHKMGQLSQSNRTIINLPERNYSIHVHVFTSAVSTEISRNKKN